MLDHITTTEIDAGILIEELSKYCDEGKSKEVIKIKNKEDFTGIKVIEGIKLLSKLGLGLLIIDTLLKKICPGSYLDYFKNGNTVDCYICVIKPAVKEFVQNINHIIYLDGTFCKNGGHLFCFSFLYVNHHIQPLACYYSKSEQRVYYSPSHFQQIFEEVSFYVE